MNAIRLTEPGRLERVASDAPADLGAGQALVRVHRIGICGTDYHAFAGRQPFFSYPRILGHELGVEVLEVGPDVTRIARGAHCAVLPYLECGTCIACRRGRPNCCANLRVLGVHIDGGMQERMVVPADKLFAHDRLSYDQLALVETLGIGAHAVARAAVDATDHVVVVGLGPIGLGVAQSARARGAAVTGVDADPARIAFARDVFGIESAAEPEPATAVFDATGNPASMNAAPGRAAPSGRVVFVGLHKGDVTFGDELFHRRELTLMASRNATAAEFHAVIDGMASGAIDTTPWITHRTDVEHIVADLPRFAERSSGVLKAMLEMP